MSYSTSNPPACIAKHDAGHSLWLYASADPIADVDAAGYITNAGDLGMKSGDPVMIIDTTNGLLSFGKVTVSSGAGTLTALTAFP